MWRWLADQPPYIEVAIGMGFVLVLAPTILAAAALLCSKLETLGESIGTQLIARYSGTWQFEAPLRRDTQTSRSVNRAVTRRPTGTQT